MFNPNFDPLKILEELQTLQAEQAQNLVNVSEWMLSISKATSAQSQQLDHLFSMVSAMNKQLLFLDERIKLLERHLQESINNTEISHQV